MIAVQIANICIVGIPVRRKHDIVTRIIRRLTIAKHRRSTQDSSLCVGNKSKLCSRRSGE